jgi:hypothetical protein
MFVDHAFWTNLDYPVADGLNKFMVVRRHQDIALEFYQGIVESLD